MASFQTFHPLVQHTGFIIDKVRWLSSLIFHQLSGKRHDITFPATSYAEVTKEVPSENNLEN